MNRLRSLLRVSAVFCLLVIGTRPCGAAQVVRLSEENWNLVPAGKEVDAIYGDYLLRNDKVVAVVGDVAPTRNANLSTRDVQGVLLDFTTLEANNDQLTAFFPHAFAGVGPPAARAEVVTAEGAEVRLRVTRPAKPDDPVETTTDYVLRDGEEFLTVITRRKNTGDKPVGVRVNDRIKCEAPFEQPAGGAHHVANYYDKWFRAAYGVMRPEGMVQVISPTVQRGAGLLGYPSSEGEDRDGLETIPPGQAIELTRLLIAAKDTAGVQRVAYAVRRLSPPRIAVQVLDDKGAPVGGADVVVRQGKDELAAALSAADGSAAFRLLPGKYTVDVTQIGRKPVERQAVDVTGDHTVTVKVGGLSRVAFDVTDERSQSVPCKVQFVGVGTTPNPDLGPIQRANGCRNLYFSTKGEFTVDLPPGQYYAILSRGPECDAAYRPFTLNEGQTVRLAARLPKVVKSDGWISADFHNHSSPSGDNSTEPESRIACLVAEGVDFAACTEHQRIDTYRARLKAMGLDKLLATSDGMELTGGPLPLNHQNAFPLVLKERTQNGGGPTTASDPREQIKRLYEHDGRSEKLVQQNHPDIGWLLYDRNGDGRHDEGYGTLEFTDVMEIFRENILDMEPASKYGAQVGNNRAFNWLQLLNQGHRVVGVANTDAHNCFHDSGTERTYVHSPTDDPAEVREMDVVRAAKRGRMVMTTGPFMEVSLNDALPGDDLNLPNGGATLKVRVQCPNWFDVDRVQVLVNGRPEPALNFTRAKHPDRFADAVVKFDQAIPLMLDKDAHVIVVAVGEQSSTGPVMGMGQLPIAVSNPIYVDVDGGGFTANKDTLGAPLPTKLPR